MSNTKGTHTAVALGIGLLVGGASAMLLAPRSGRSTRRRIKAYADGVARNGKARVAGVHRDVKARADGLKSAWIEGKEAYASS